jgi:hypothetical protein
VPLALRSALLALAALAAVAVAAVRITNAAEHRTIVAEQAGPEREVTPTQAAATLSKLHSPPGFRQVTQCRFPERDRAEKCFWTPHALPIDVQAIRRIAAFWREQAVGIPLLSGCFGARHWRGGMVFRHCNWDLELGPELVAVFSDSLLVPHGRERTRIARKALRYWRRGTEIHLVVIGHWPRTGPPHRSEVAEKQQPQMRLLAGLAAQR